MSKPLLLDLFCGVGGAAKGYSDAGFEIVGVDINPQPNYPYEFHQADAMAYPLEGFDVIHASPPCQRFTALKTAWNAKDHPDLLQPTRLRLRGKPYVIENVPGAPLQTPLKLCGTMFGLGVEVYDGWRDLWRHRLFESPVSLLPPGKCKHSGPTIGIYGDHARDRRRKPGVRDRGIDFPDTNRLQLGRDALGVVWAERWTELSQVVPPAFTYHIGQQLLEQI